MTKATPLDYLKLLRCKPDRGSTLIQMGSDDDNCFLWTNGWIYVEFRSQLTCLHHAASTLSNLKALEMIPKSVAE